MALLKTKPLASYLNELRAGGIEVGPFPTRNKDRYGLRVIDPEHPDTGYGFIASFSSSKEHRVTEADRPDGNAVECERRTKWLDDMLHSTGLQARFVVCYCVNEETGEEYDVIAYSGTAKSDAYKADASVASTEAAVASATKDGAKPKGNGKPKNK